jgi:hypothetical protein
MDITDYVEGPVFGPSIVPKRLTFDDRRIDFLCGTQNVHVPESLALKIPQGATELTVLVAHDVRPKRPVRTVRVPVLT